MLDSPKNMQNVVKNNNLLPQLSLDDLENMARGAAFLGTGGGGDPYLGRLIMQHIFAKYGTPKLINVEALKDDDPVYIAAMMGAPSVMVEKITGVNEVETAISALEQHLGRPAAAIMPAEIGGMNALLPLAIAAKRGIPVIDADGMGRAFPELQMVTFAVYGIPTSPFAVANEHGEYHVIKARDNKASENAARQLAIQMGASVGLSCYPMLGADAKRTAVRGTVSLALGIGRAITEGRTNGDPFVTLQTYLHSTDYYNQCKLLYSGKIADVSRKVDKGFTVGKCIITGESSAENNLEIIFQNEHLRASLNGQTICIVPDLICILDAESAEPITTEGLRYGQRVKVMGVSCAPIMRRSKALQTLGPRAFGFDEDFVPIEDLIESH
ncbi:MAG: DUF917 domain-containing protein [Alphaproteobacteria bacterium]|nr:DUF917 domain-containing protein [Alphaproteobacteria bacterium]